LSSSSFDGGSRCTGQVSQNADPKHKVSIKVQKHKIGNYSQPFHKAARPGTDWAG
jgi:hypothetical protein